MADAACFLAAHGEDSVPLCLGDGSLAGTVSNRDIVAQVVAKGRDPREVSLAEFAEPAGVVALDVDVSVEEAVRHHVPAPRGPVARDRWTIASSVSSPGATWRAPSPSGRPGTTAER